MSTAPAATSRTDPGDILGRLLAEPTEEDRQNLASVAYDYLRRQMRFLYRRRGYYLPDPVDEFIDSAAGVAIANLLAWRETDGGCSIPSLRREVLKVLWKRSGSPRPTADTHSATHLPLPPRILDDTESLALAFFTVLRGMTRQRFWAEWDARHPRLKGLRDNLRRRIESHPELWIEDCVELWVCSPHSDPRLPSTTLDTLQELLDGPWESVEALVDLLPHLLKPSRTEHGGYVSLYDLATMAWIALETHWTERWSERNLDEHATDSLLRHFWDALRELAHRLRLQFLRRHPNEEQPAPVERSYCFTSADMVARNPIGRARESGAPRAQLGNPEWAHLSQQALFELLADGAASYNRYHQNSIDYLIRRVRALWKRAL